MHPICFLFQLSLLFVACHSTRPNTVYQTVFSDKILFCTKLLNNNSAAIGCDGSLFPEFGILLNNVTQDQIDFIENNTFYYSFIPIFHVSLLNLTQSLIKLNRLNRSIVGVIIVNRNSSETPKDNFARSDDVSCPNRNVLNNQSDCFRWINRDDNAIGSFFRHFNFPIFYLEDSEIIDMIQNCTSKWNSDLFKNSHSLISFRGNDLLNFKPFCAAEMYQANYASINISADRCLAQRDRFITLDKVSYCDKIYGNIILVPVMPMHHTNAYENRSILMLIVRLDSLSLFSGKSPGSDSVYSALITLASIAQTLSQNKILFSNTSRQVILGFYKGESLSYIGSSFHSYELNQNRDKKGNQESFSDTWDYSGIRHINLDQIGFVLELNQLASHNDDSVWWLYSKKPSNQSGSSYLRDLLLKWSHSVQGVSLKQVNTDLPFPPSSSHSFRAYNSCLIETAMITNHQGSFTNRYYHSLFDQTFNVISQPSNGSKINSSVLRFVTHLSRIATVVSRTLGEFLAVDHRANLSFLHNISADVGFINETVHCIFVNQNCSLFRRMQRTEYNESNFQDTDILSPNRALVEFVYDLMVYLTAEVVFCPNETQSNQEQAYFYRKESNLNNTNTCLRFQVFQQKASSPLHVPKSDWDLSHWVIGHHRPLWASPKLRIFLLSSRSYDLMVISLGIIAIFYSIVVIKLCFQSKSLH